MLEFPWMILKLFMRAHKRLINFSSYRNHFVHLFKLNLQVRQWVIVQINSPKHFRKFFSVCSSTDFARPEYQVGEIAYRSLKSKASDKYSSDSSTILQRETEPRFKLSQFSLSHSRVSRLSVHCRWRDHCRQLAGALQDYFMDRTSLRGRICGDHIGKCRYAKPLNSVKIKRILNETLL